MKLNYQQRDSFEVHSPEYLFKYLILINIVLYIEAGAVPCELDTLSIIGNLSGQEQGALGGVVYLALSAASPVCGYVFQHYDIKMILTLTLVLNNLFVLLFALAPPGDASYFIVLRAGVGFTQAFVSVYSPLWIDEYAPARACTGWLSYLQGAVPVGVMLGYGLGMLANATAIENSSTLLSFGWRWPFLIQFLLVVPFILGMIMIPKEHLSISFNQMDLVPSKEREHKYECRSDLLPSLSTISSFAFQDIPISSSSTRQPMVGCLLEDDLVGSFTHPHHSSLDEQYFTTLQNDHHSQEIQSLNLVQRNAIRASYVVPRLRLDSFYTQGRARFCSSPNSTAPSSNHSSPSSSSSSQYGSIVGHASRNCCSAPPSRSFSRSSSRSSLLISSRTTMTNIGSQLLELFRIREYTYLILGLSSVYFVVTGIQYWGTIYMTKSLHASVFRANIMFVLISGTGPIAGVYAGGRGIDHIGGYKHSTEQRCRALKMCMILGSFATSLALTLTFVSNFFLSGVLLWLVMFFGGATLPACTGIFLSVIPRPQRALASATSVLIFNLIGFALSPYLTGLVMSKILSTTNDEARAYRLGFRFCMFWCLWSLLFLGLAYRHVRRKLSAQLEEGNNATTVTDPNSNPNPNHALRYHSYPIPSSAIFH